MKVISVKIKTPSLLSFLLTTILFAGCSSGNNGTDNNTQTKQQAPQGPVSYEHVIAKFKQPSVKKTATTFVDPLTDCGDTMSSAGSGVEASSIFLNFIPEAGDVLGDMANSLGPMLDLFGGRNTTSCIMGDFMMVENQLNTMQTQINNIENVLSLNDNLVWSSVSQNADNIDATNYTSFIDAIQYFNAPGSDSFFYQAYNAAGFYNNNTGQLTAYTLNDLSSSESNLNNLNNILSTYLGSAAITFKTNLENISGTSYPTGDCTDCYKSVALAKSSTFYNLLSDANAVLTTTMIDTLASNPDANLIPMLDDYNNTLMSYYQQSISALQAAYHILYLVNYLNYSQSAVTQPNLLGVPWTYYVASPGASSIENTAAYNNAQEQLTLFFAALINQVYTNTISYIVTNPPVWAQSYADTESIPYENESGQVLFGAPINYTALVGSALGGNSSPNGYLFNALKNYSNINKIGTYDSLESNLNNLGFIYYQYGGLNNVAQCRQSIISSNAISGSTMASALTPTSTDLKCPNMVGDNNSQPVNKAVFSVNTMQPYSENTIGPGLQGVPILSGDVTNNINPTACNYQQVGSFAPWSMYLYTPTQALPTNGVVGLSYLMCGNWQTSNLSTNPQPAGNTLIPGPYGINGVQLDSSSYTMSMLAVTGSPIPGEEISMNLGTQIDFRAPTAVMQVGAAGLWSTKLDGWNPLGVGSYVPFIVSGWVNDNLINNALPTQNVIAMQTTTPDGFIAPYGIAMIMDYTQQLNTIGVGPNPNVIAAGVTLGGLSIYDTNNINFNNGQFNSLTSLVHSHPWSPVTSTSPAILNYYGAAGGMVSSLVVNGYLLATVGSTSEVTDTSFPSAGYATICFANPNTIAGASSVNYAGTSLIKSVTEFGLNCY